MRATAVLAAFACLPACAVLYQGVAVAPDGVNAWVAANEGSSSYVFHTSDFGETWSRA